jgi:hypothetical protein
MRTTVNIKDAILEELRKRAAATGRPFREVLERSLEIGLAHMDRAPSRRRFRVRPHRLGLKPGFQGVSLNQLYDQLESEQALRNR